METRSSAKRKATDTESSGPSSSKKVKSTKDKTTTAARSTRNTQRTAKQLGTRTRRGSESSPETQAAADQQQVPASNEEPRKSVSVAQAPAANTFEGPSSNSMERSGRRGSRGEAPAASGEEDRDAGDMFGRNFGAAGNALQGLLRKLGAGFEDMLPVGMSGARIKGILSGMKQFDDEGAQLSSLTELCELLSISTEESLSTFPVEQVVPVLVQLLGMEHNPDIMLLAARALTFMADVLPASCGAIVRHGAVPAFCARLLTIEYIDLAEQSLQALEKLSHEHPQALLQHGGLLAVLSYLDFFPTGVQRTAVATAATMCSGLGPSHASAVRDALPMLCNLLQYQDAKVVDNACMALLHIAEAYAHDAALLDQLQMAGLINQALQLISISTAGSSTSSTQTSISTYFGMIKLLSTCASGSAAIAQQLLKAGVIDTLRQLLANCTMLGNIGSTGGAAPVLRTPDQLYEVMTLAHELLPEIPDASAMLMRDLPTHSAAAAANSGAVSEGMQAMVEGGQPDSLVQYLKEEPEMVMTFCQGLLPLTLQVYSATVMPNVRSRCLATVVKLLAVASPRQLEKVLAELPISSFVAGLLGGRDVKAQAAAMQMAEILMAKLPAIFTGYFVKEGVAYALGQLAATVPSSAASAAPAAEAAEPSVRCTLGGKSSAPVPIEAGCRTSSGAGSSRADLPPPSPPVTRSRRSHRTDMAKPETREPAAATSAAPSAAAAIEHSGTGIMRSPSYTLRDAVAKRAAVFKEQHFKTDGPGAMAELESEGLRQLRQLCEQLMQDDSCMPAVLESLTSSDVSVFELLTSGAVNHLTDYLQGNDLPASTSKDEQLLQRLRSFTIVALSVQPIGAGGSKDLSGAAAAAAAAGNVRLAALVRKLQSALASAEAFPVLCSRIASSSAAAGGSRARSLSRPGSLSSSFNSSSLTSGLAALTQPFKLRLVRHPEECFVKEYPANIVLIEPLANMSAIEDFLWPRVNRGSTAELLRARAAAETATGGSATAGRSSNKAEEPGGAAATVPPPPPPPSAVASERGSKPATGTAAATAASEAAEGSRRRQSSSSGGGKETLAIGGGRTASKAQPIPDADTGNGRMTRAQAARARAEAQARAEEAANQRKARRAASRGGSSASDLMSEDYDVSEVDMLRDLMQHHGSSDHEDEHMHDEDEDHGMDGAGEDGIFDHGDDDEDEDMEDDGDLDIGSMPVHDLHLAEAAAAAAAADRAGASRPSEDRSSAAAAASKANREATATAAARGLTADAAAAAAGSAGDVARAPWTHTASQAVAAAAAGSRTAAAVAAVAAPKLMFYINGQPLAAGSTVFQAIQQSALNAIGDADEDTVADEGIAGNTGRRGRQLWDQVHTLHYRLACTPDGASSSGAAACSTGTTPAAAAAGPKRQNSSSSNRHCSASSAPAGDDVANGERAAQSHWRHTPLGELLSVQLPEHLAAPQSCVNILRLLQLLEVVNRLAPRLLASHELQLLQAGATGQQQKGQADDNTGSPKLSRGKADRMASAELSVGIAAGQAQAGQMALAHVSREEFVSSKLGNKLAQQLKDVLSICGGGVPAWCHQLVIGCRFLFPFEVRRRYFYSTAFGLGRALHHMHQQQAAEGVGGALERDGRELRIGRLQRQKVRVSRRRILESAVKVMELYAKHRAVLELEYFGEVGTGLGPTLEFYTMLSHELQKKSLGMWRHEEPPEPEQQEQQPEATAAASEGSSLAAAAAAAVGPGRKDSKQQQAAAGSQPPSRASSRPISRSGSEIAPSVQLHQEVVSHDAATATAAEYVYAPYGLFPAPLLEEQRVAGNAIVEHFKLLGRAVAKALQDNRLLDMPLNPVFFRAVLGKPLDLYDVAEIDPVLGSSLEKLAKAAAANAAAGAEGPVVVDGCSVEDLCLTFTLPGNPAFELRSNGADVLVDSFNLVSYIQAIVDVSLGSGINAQLTAFQEGFNEVFALETLEVFREDEMEVLLCGAGEHWGPQQLADSMKFDHGYTAQSTPVRHLLEILSELEPGDQRRFLRFVTGCPRLPPGGIAALQPRLTVVRKHPSLLPASDGPTPSTTPGHNSSDWSNGTPLADGDLPSVMTCANYIKLPPYSCKEVMRERLMFAIREGQGSFDLS